MGQRVEKQVRNVIVWRGWSGIARAALLAVPLALVASCGADPAVDDDGGEEPYGNVGELSSMLRKSEGGTNGDTDYCGSAPIDVCVAGEGDCDNDAECTPGTVCVYDVGARFGMPSGHDVCLPAHCRNRRQDVGLGEEGVDCGGACGVCPGTACGDWSPGVDACTSVCPCAPTRGDCDLNADCVAGAYCERKVGDVFGLSASWDVCIANHCKNGILDGDETGTDCGGSCIPCGPDACPAFEPGVDACTTICPCSEGEGDCDTDAQCGTGLICGSRQGERFGFPAGWDVCIPATCRNGVQDPDEAGLDCGGVCGGCPNGCGGWSPNGEKADDRCAIGDALGFWECDGIDLTCVLDPDPIELGQTCKRSVHCISGNCSNGHCAPSGFAWIPGGEFTIGSPVDEPGRFNDENQTARSVSTFFLQSTEMTQSEWVASGWANPSGFAACGDDCPVERVNWWEALQFANWRSGAEALPACYAFTGCTGTPGDNLSCSTARLTGGATRPADCDGYRLPTEAEWERAVRAETTTAFYNGPITQTSGVDPLLSRIGWYSQNSLATPRPVKGRQPNAWGLWDMSGNVWEWVWDVHSSSYLATDTVDYAGPASGPYRVRRGGSWNNFASFARSASRGQLSPGFRGTAVGFRLARSAPPVLEGSGDAP